MVVIGPVVPHEKSKTFSPSNTPVIPQRPSGSRSSSNRSTYYVGPTEAHTRTPRTWSLYPADSDCSSREVTPIVGPLVLALRGKSFPLRFPLLSEGLGPFFLIGVTPHGNELIGASPTGIRETQL